VRLRHRTISLLRPRMEQSVQLHALRFHFLFFFQGDVHARQSLLQRQRHRLGRAAPPPGLGAGAERGAARGRPAHPAQHRPPGELICEI
jgi:hypothetical protein